MLESKTDKEIEKVCVPVFACVHVCVCVQVRDKDRDKAIQREIREIGLFLIILFFSYFHFQLPQCRKAGLASSRHLKLLNCWFVRGSSSLIISLICSPTLSLTHSVTHPLTFLTKTRDHREIQASVLMLLFTVSLILHVWFEIYLLNPFLAWIL
jgi:hypothetical protein